MQIADAIHELIKPKGVGVDTLVLGDLHWGDHDPKAIEANYDYFDNKAIPPLIISVSGGGFSKDTVKVVENYVDENIKGRQNFHKILILEALPAKQLTGTEKIPKIEVKELGLSYSIITCPSSNLEIQT